MADIQPPPLAVLLRRGVEFHIARLAVPHLRVDPQHRPQRDKALRQKRPQPVLLRAIGHHILFDLHLTVPFFSRRQPTLISATEKMAALPLIRMRSPSWVQYSVPPRGLA